MLYADYIFRFISQIDFREIGLFILAIMMTALIVTRIRQFSSWISKKFPSKRMAVFGWVPVICFLLYFGGIFGSFYFIFQPRREFLIAFLLSGVVAIGIAVKDIVASIIGGVVLLMDRPFQVGDRITFEGEYGEIIAMGLRSVNLLTVDESVVTIPNQRFISDVVKSNSRGKLEMMTTVDVYVPQPADLGKVRDILHKEARSNSYVDARKKIVVLGKEVLNGDGTVFSLMTLECVLKDARLEKIFQTDFLIGVSEAFKRQGIKRKRL